ncbi:MAG: fumarylacetoacetase [Streptosporangiaceae bacterium]
MPGRGMFDAETRPYGSFTTAAHPTVRRACVAVGDQVLDVTDLDPVFADGTLDVLLAAGPVVWADMRSTVAAAEGPLVPLADVRMELPFTVSDYVDFYASEHHATNLGRLFRPGTEPLTPNWKHLPIGYHGRAGTVVVSGTPIRRPSGQSKPAGADQPVFGPCARLDLEAELGFVVGTPSALGEPVPTGAFADHVFGVCLVNDWSARDLQAWEYVPLGPFLGKSFATSVSPWVVPLAALEQARVRPPSADTDLLPYLREKEDWGLDIQFEVRLNGHLLTRPPYATTHWSPAQMLAHLTVNGASVRTGDLFASGTVSGPGADQAGSLIELTRAGAEPLTLPDGTTRAWLADGDEVRISAVAAGGIFLGEVAGRVG